ncbi:MAG TPA: hypothetical protein VM841_13580 [Actinomycetota bacterium]|nr:hypothetical protein [Actinomycetota bacterium]
MSVLAQRLLAVHDALDAAALPHAFGGAIALAYCIEEPRGTRDIDVNIFVPSSRIDEALDAMPAGIVVTATQRATAHRDGQVRLFWDDTPVDVFFDTDEFHKHAAAGIGPVPFFGRTIPVLGCVALVVFKAMFDRTKDWADIEAVAAANTPPTRQAAEHLARILGPDDPRIERLHTLISEIEAL